MDSQAPAITARSQPAIEAVAAPTIKTKKKATTGGTATIPEHTLYVLVAIALFVDGLEFLAVYIGVLLILLRVLRPRTITTTTNQQQQKRKPRNKRR